MKQDISGQTVSGASARALERFHAGLHGLQTFTGDPVAAAEEALAEAPDFVMAHVLKGYLFGLSTEGAARAVALASHAAAAGMPMTARERAHCTALGHLAKGNWHRASQILEEISIEHPRDVLAIQAGHQIDFFTGNARMLRDRVARALPFWDVSMPGYHAILGMSAFGLEETGDYARAEAAGRRAIELEPRDGWARHAVAHVMEMQCRQREGIEWLRGSEADWTSESFLKTHNWWHLALFHFELGDIPEVLALVDGPIFGTRSTIALNMVDASAILWRLHLRGVDVGPRWEALARNWLPHARAATYAFNDVHAMMAFTGAGMAGAQTELLAAQEEAMEAGDDNARFTRDVGRPVALAIKAFGEGRHDEVVGLLKPVRGMASAFGGSHAQRDVIDLTLIEAAFRSGTETLSRALVAERHHARPESPFSQLLMQRAGFPATG